MRYCLFFLVFIVTKSPAQFELFRSYYFDLTKSSYNINLGITLASPKGNYSKAQELLNSDFFKENSEATTQINALLLHNSKGKEKAISFINDSKISLEEQDFAKLWLSFYTNNDLEYTTLLVSFKEKYPLNYHPLKLKLRAVLNYRDDSIWNKIKEQKANSITTLDSLINLPNIIEEDRLYFSLMKLDFLKKNDFRSEEKEYSKEKLLDEIVAFYLKNKSYFHLKNLLITLKNSDSDKYNDLINEINEELTKDGSTSSSEHVFTLLVEYNRSDKEVKVSDLETSINKIISNEKNLTEVSKITALLSVFSLANEPDLGFFLKGLLKPIPFSNTFKQSYSPSPSNKQIIIDNTTSLLKEPLFDGIANNKHKFNEELESIKQMSTEDVHAFYGLVVFSSYFTKPLQFMKEAFGDFQNAPTIEDYKSIESYIQFLEKNTLYIDDSHYLSNNLEFKNDNDFLIFIEHINRLKNTFPGSATILKNGIDCLQANHDKISEDNLQNYYLSYFKLALDYLTVSKIIKSKDKYDLELFSPIVNYKRDYNFDTYFESFYNLLTEKSKKESTLHLDRILLQNSTNNDLLEIKQIIKSFKN